MRLKTLSYALAAFVLAACGSSGIGDILGGGGSPNPSASTAEIRGTVDYVDTQNRFVQLTNVTNYRTNLADQGYGGGDTARVYYDQQTTVSYQGQNYEPAALERGDQVAVQVRQNGNQLFATAMSVLYDSSGGGTSTGANQTTLRGTVRYVEPTRRTVQIDTGGYNSQLVTLDYDANTTVDYNGRRYRIEDLQRGDEVEVRVRNLGSGRYLADQIMVIRSTGTNTPSATTMRGTVRSVDTSRRTITIDQASWVQRFDSGTAMGTVVLQYDSSTVVEYQGRNYAPTNLERGDVIDVEVRQLGTNSYLAQRISVVRDVNTYR